MVKGILGDANSLGQIEALVHQMQIGTWADFWKGFGLCLKHFQDVGLTVESTDMEIWREDSFHLGSNRMARRGF